jgi:transposase
MVQDNASYHKDADVWGRFKSNRHWLEAHQLPPYSPELNPTERLWRHTRKNGTHNRFFAGLDALVATLTRIFGEMQSHPQLISSYLAPYCRSLCPFNYARLSRKGMIVTVSGQLGKDVPVGTLRAILRSAGLEGKGQD